MRKSNRNLVITGSIVALIVFGLIFLPGIITGQSVNPGTKVPLAISSSPIIGNPDAPLTIYEFTDFSCPFCQRFSIETLPYLEEKYIETGKAKLVFKYFPGHGSGQAAHIIALALNEQSPELFYKFHNAAFSNPEDLGSLSKMKSLALSLGADLTKLESSLDENNYLAQLQADTLMGRANGIKGTPSFIIGGKIIVGAQDLEVFEDAIDSAL